MRRLLVAGNPPSIVDVSCNKWRWLSSTNGGHVEWNRLVGVDMAL